MSPLPQLKFDRIRLILLLLSFSLFSAGVAIDSSRPPPEQILVRTAVNAINIYQKSRIPLLSGRTRCKFYPTCSDYAKLAYLKSGFFPGSAMAAYRIISCSPLTNSEKYPIYDYP
ncbi:MAG TPA: membrane protein insertion efficiency factor YidD [bacterium]|nr:membrane protein insertion efficiency factor YidD [bacterium]